MCERYSRNRPHCVCRIHEPATIDCQQSKAVNDDHRSVAASSLPSADSLDWISNPLRGQGDLGGQWLRLKGDSLVSTPRFFEEDLSLIRRNCSLKYDTDEVFTGLRIKHVVPSLVYFHIESWNKLYIFASTFFSSASRYSHCHPVSLGR